MKDEQFLADVDYLVADQPVPEERCMLCNKVLKNHTKSFHALCYWDRVQALANRRKFKSVRVSAT